jgi:hypothetical protein
MDLSAEIHAMLLEAKRILCITPDISKEQFIGLLLLSEKSDKINNLGEEEVCPNNQVPVTNTQCCVAESEVNKKDNTSSEKKFYIKTSKEWKTMEVAVKKAYEKMSNPNELYDKNTELSEKLECKKKELYDAVPKFLQITKKGKVEKLENLPGIAGNYFTRQIRGIHGQLIFKNSEKEFEEKIPVGFLFSDKSFIFF